MTTVPLDNGRLGNANGEYLGEPLVSWPPSSVAQSVATRSLRGRPSIAVCAIEPPSAVREKSVLALGRSLFLPTAFGSSLGFCAGGLAGSILVLVSPDTSADGPLRSGETSAVATSGSFTSSGTGFDGGVSGCGFFAAACAGICSDSESRCGGAVAGFASPWEELPANDFAGPLFLSPNSVTGRRVGIGLACWAAVLGCAAAGGGGEGGGGGSFFASSGGFGSGGFSSGFGSGFFSSGGGTSSTFTLSSSTGFGSIFGSPRMRRAMIGICATTDATTPQRISGRCFPVSCCVSAGSTSSSVTAAMWPLKPAASSHKRKKPRDRAAMRVIGRRLHPRPPDCAPAIRLSEWHRRRERRKTGPCRSRHRARI